MSETVLWVGGWASDLACWRRELSALYPRREHAFLDAQEALLQPGLLERTAAALPAGATLAAWSMGSLLVHAALEGGFNPACRVVSLSPIFDFCGDGGVSPATLARMIRRLPKARETVLAEFWTLARGNSPVTAGAEAAWKEQARGHSLDALLRGLEFLAETRVPPSAAARAKLVASRIDPLAPAPRGNLDARWVMYPSGHLPFFDHPGLVGPLLEGAA